MAFLHNKLILLTRDVIRDFFLTRLKTKTSPSQPNPLVVVMAQPGALLAHKLISPYPGK